MVIHTTGDFGCALGLLRHWAMRNVRYRATRPQEERFRIWKIGLVSVLRNLQRTPEFLQGAYEYSATLARLVKQTYASRSRQNCG
jgi:hypothetical protein